MSGDRTPTGETLFEFRQVGKQLRVAAIDGATGTEVIVIAPLNAPRSQVQSVAQAKLRRRMAQTQSET